MCWQVFFLVSNLALGLFVLGVVVFWPLLGEDCTDDVIGAPLSTQLVDMRILVVYMRLETV